MPAPRDADGWPRGAVARFSLLLWITYAYFIPSPSWNPNSRFDLTLAIVEQGQLAIDNYHLNTGDKSVYEGHFYSDKAPGVAFLAVAPYAVFRAAWRWGGGDVPRVLAVGRDGLMDARSIRGDGEDDVLLNPSYRWGQYVASVFTSGLAGGALGGVMLVLARHFGLQRPAATTAAMAASLGTLVFPYATSFYGHVPAAALALAAFAALAVAPTRTAPRLLTSGLLAGVGVACEWPAALVAVALAFYIALHLRVGWRAWPWLAGVTMPIALALLYNHTAFGGPLQSGYAHLERAEFRAGMAQGVYGISWPSPRVLLAVLIGRERGLLYVSPVLALALWGLLHRFVRGGERAVRWLCFAIFAAFALLSSAYYMWWGGYALGPRHAIPALCFCMLGLCWWLTNERAAPNGERPSGTWWKEQGTFATIALSIVNMTLGTAVGPEAPRTSDVLFRYVYPLAATGRVPNAPGASNFGRLLGLPGMLSILPLAALWLVYISRVWPLVPKAPGTPRHNPL